MSLDIAAIKQRWLDTAIGDMDPAYIAALIDEVEELREELTAFEANAAEVFCVLTGGRISKVNTLASVVIAEAEAYNERTCVADAWDAGFRAADIDCTATVSWGRCGVSESCDKPSIPNPYRSES